jgi:hypothetical protein
VLLESFSSDDEFDDLLDDTDTNDDDDDVLDDENEVFADDLEAFESGMWRFCDDAPTVGDETEASSGEGMSSSIESSWAPQHIDRSGSISW